MDTTIMQNFLELGAVGVLGIIVWHAMGIFRTLLMEKRWEKTGTKTPPKGYPVDFASNQISDRVVYDVSVSLSKLVVGQEQQTKTIEELVSELRANRSVLLRHATQTTDFIQAYGRKLTGEKIPTQDNQDEGYVD